MRVGVTGHQKMPQEAYDFASNFLEQYLRTHDGVIGVSSLASGADQLFAKKLIDADGELYIVIPCKGYETTFDEDSLGSYNTLLLRATERELLDFSHPSEEAFFAAGRRIAELADVLISVWDGEPAQGLGGTADVVNYAKELGKPVIVVWPDGVKR